MFSKALEIKLNRNYPKNEEAVPKELNTLSINNVR